MWNYETGKCLKKFDEIEPLRRFALMDDKYLHGNFNNNELRIYDKNDLDKHQRIRLDLDITWSIFDNDEPVYLGDRRFVLVRGGRLFILEIKLSKK
jgi:hypothetical protein